MSYKSESFFSKIFVSTTDTFSSFLLDNPYLFNHVRFLLAGRQTGMKKFIKKHLKEYNCVSVADICSGTGDFAELVSKNSTYTGWDVNDDFINYAKKRYATHKNKQFVNANILKEKKLLKQKFDAVLLISTIHHFSDDELKVLLPAIKKITKKVIIIADIIPDAPHAIQRFFARIDRGKFVRPGKEKVAILSKYFHVVKTIEIPTRSAVQLGIICIPK